MVGTQQVTSQKIGGLGGSPSIGECLHEPVLFRQKSEELTRSSRQMSSDESQKTVRALADGVEVLGRSPLGKYHEICVKPNGWSLAKQAKTSKQNPEKQEELRAERYALQSIAIKAIPKERVAICLRRKIKRNEEVSVWKHEATQKCFYGGLAVCGSVWTCPVCASRISEKRRKELKQTLALHKKAGGHVAMLTLTFSHKKDDVLKDSLKKFAKALKTFRSGGRYQKVRKKLGLIGTIRTFEITYGDNGFHPHPHLLLLFMNEVDLKEIEKELFVLWERACQANDLVTKEGYGLTLQDGEKASEYVSKWGLEEEMTKSHSKKGKQGGLTPFDFLRKYQETEDKKYLKLFEEYAFATKGKSQLQWSKGLKAMFGIGEKSDEELATEKTETAELIGTVEDEVWKWILRSEKRGQFLRLVEQHCDIELAFDILLEDYQDGDDG